MIKKISAKEAERELKKQGLGYGMDGTTYYAINTENKSIFSFDTKRERDEWVANHY